MGYSRCGASAAGEAVEQAGVSQPLLVLAALLSAVQQIFDVATLVAGQRPALLVGCVENSLRFLGQPGGLGNNRGPGHDKHLSGVAVSCRFVLCASGPGTRRSLGEESAF